MTSNVINVIVGLLLSIVLGMAGCGSGAGSDNDASIATTNKVVAVVSIVDGNNQTATVGTELSNPLVALIKNSEGQRIPSQTVNFRVTKGGGTVFAGAATSDAYGIVRERWTLGPESGEQQVEVRAVDSHGAAVVFATFTATAVSAAPQYIYIISGNNQSAQQLQQLPLPVKVQVKDAYGNLNTGVSVVFTANNGGTVTPVTVNTNVLGEAESSWTLGLVIGVQTLSVTVTGLSTVIFSATATQAPPTDAVSMTKISGDLQTIVQHTTSSWNLKVIITDALGNGVPGESVSFSAVPETGYVKPVVTSSDSDGAAVGSMSYVHTSGQMQIMVSVTGVPSVVFTINVTPNDHLYDGYYIGSGVEFTVTNGIFKRLSPSASLGAGTLNEADGTLNFWYGHVARTVHYGQIVIDSLQNATASGTKAGWNTSQPWPLPVCSDGTLACYGAETWTCERQ
ncbi:MAG: hypothetical protein HZA20_08715 [Nitrospirae bacterium]|nr:hypothetical protein [Nitrospirota bacterium]